MAEKRALYLAGGGARGAYQAGVLKAIGHILQVKSLPFDVVSGVSVGTINAVALAENANDFPAALEKLESIWTDIRCQQIYKTSNLELSRSVVRNVGKLFTRKRQSGHLLDTRPLQQFVEDTFDFSQIERHITDGFLNALEVICVCYETNQTISFYQHTESQFSDWYNPRHSSQKTIINAKHILASSALPLFFPTINLEGAHYGDGSIGLISPLRGAIRFAVDKILILGTRELPEFNPVKPLNNEGIPFSNILGTMFNGLFLDNLDRDIEMVNRMTEITLLVSIWNKRRSPWRPISTLHLRPSRNMASLAEQHHESMPALLRYLLSLLGAKSKSGELLSFLLFEKGFTRELLQLGFSDTMAMAKEVVAFFK